MFCQNCGTRQNDNARFCENCGAAVDGVAQPYAPAQQPYAPTQQPYAPEPQTYNLRLVGFSNRINDPIFEANKKASFRKNLKHGLLFFPILLLLFQIVPFFSEDFTSQRAFVVGCIVGGFGLIWTLAGGARRASAKTWDGDVIDKKITERRNRNDAAATGYDLDYYHTIVFRLTSGGKKKMQRKLRTNEMNAWDMMIYLNIGDRVRYHGKLDYYEKYDKSRDAEVPCANCHKYVDIQLEHCPVCQAPIIKP